jgi:HemY protein
MRVALWFLGLFGVAVALALFASGNAGTITVFWPPYRVDLSLNMVVLLLGLLFVLMHLALKALSALFALPGQARSWRMRHQERAMHAALLEALSHLLAGRFLRARKAAQTVLAREAALTQSGEVSADASRLRVLANLLAAESSQSLQDRQARELHFQQAFTQADASDAGGTRDGLLLRAVRWSLEDHDAAAALDWLDQLPSGVARRTVALRLRLQVARMAGKSGLALETARLLAKHRAFSDVSARSLLRSLAQEWIQSAYDLDQLQVVWRQLEPNEQSLPEVACAAAGRWMRLGGPAPMAFEWLLPVWQRLVSSPEGLSQDQKIMLVRVMENGFSATEDAIDAQWLSRIEQAQMTYPGDAILQYLAGVACLHLQLWGKAHQLIRLALPRLEDAGLQTRAWQVLAELAQRQGNEAEAAAAWRSAAHVRLRRKS